MAGPFIRSGSIGCMSKAHICFSTYAEHMLVYTSRFIFTSTPKSIYVEMHYFHTNTSINANIRSTRSVTVWLATYKIQLTYGIIMIK